MGQQIFEGKFENDRVKDGCLMYPDGSIYWGQFKDGERCKDTSNK